MLKLTIYKIYKLSKFIVFTNLWKNFVYLFAKSEFVIGQFPPAFVILFLRTCLCFFNRSHSHSKWSVVLWTHFTEACWIINNLKSMKVCPQFAMSCYNRWEVSASPYARRNTFPPSHPLRIGYESMNYRCLYVLSLSMCCLCILRRGYPDCGFSVLFPQL